MASSATTEKDDDYRYGYRVGTVCASDARKEIQKVNSSDGIAQFAGSKLNGVRFNAAKDNICRRETWGVGFFDGFMDRAKEFV